MKPTSLAIAALCIAALPLGALAERGGNGNGNGNRGSSAQESRGNSASSRGNSSRENRGNSSSNRNDAARENRGNANGGSATLNRSNGNSANARANPSQGFCPPGQTRKGNGCFSSSQADARGAQQQQNAPRSVRYVAGQVLETNEFTPLPNYTDYDLPDLPAGESYAVINRTAVVIDTATQTLLRQATR